MSGVVKQKNIWFSIYYIKDLELFRVLDLCVIAYVEMFLVIMLYTGFCNQ